MRTLVEALFGYQAIKLGRLVTHEADNRDLPATPDPSPRLARDLGFGEFSTPTMRCISTPFRSPSRSQFCAAGDPRFDARMGTKSREPFTEPQSGPPRSQADRLTCEAWNKRMLALKGPEQPSPALGEALNAGYPYLEVRCLGCDTHQTVALEIIRRSKTTPIHELERYMRCKECSQVRGYSYKRSHLVALRAEQDFSE
jgi:hypothetical protein